MSVASRRERAGPPRESASDLPQPGRRACYRYRTATLVGPWRRRRDSALEDAVRAGLALRSDGTVAWRVDGDIEESLCDQGGACGGRYPPD